jgi:hypothetical protein
MVLAGWRAAVALVTKRPVIADRWPLALPPRVELTVVFGCRRVVEALTKRPLIADRCALRTVVASPVDAVYGMDVAGVSKFRAPNTSKLSCSCCPARVAGRGLRATAVKHLENTTMKEIETPADAGKTKTTINVTVAFPLGHGPYDEDFAATATVGEVRAAALTHFGVVEDPALRFYLTHNGDEVADSTTVGDVAGRAKAVRFILAREVVNG